MWGNDKSGSDVAVGCYPAPRLKHCFGVLVIFDCCFVMIVTEQGL